MLEFPSKSIRPIGIVVALLAFAVCLGQALPDRLDSGLHHGFHIGDAATPRTLGHSGPNHFVVLKAGANKSAQRQKSSPTGLLGDARLLEALAPSDLVLVASSNSAHAQCPSALRGRAPPFVS
jgi:hypothetical protein